MVRREANLADVRHIACRSVAATFLIELEANRLAVVLRVDHLVVPRQPVSALSTALATAFATAFDFLLRCTRLLASGSFPDGGLVGTSGIALFGRGVRLQLELLDEFPGSGLCAFASRF